MKNKAEQWHVLYTNSRAEKQVVERLREKGIECWLPLHKSPRIWSDRVKIVEMPLYRSYVFVKCGDDLLRRLSFVSGISHYLQFEGRPAVVTEEEILAIKEFLKLAENRNLQVGEEAEILCGSMKNIVGSICDIRKDVVVLFLKELGATVCVKLHSVAPVHRLL